MEAPSHRWPATLPAVAALLKKGLDLAPGVTFLVGENGSGKSTIVEALAEAFGLNPEGGSRGARHSTRRTESPLGQWLQLERGVPGRIWSFFLRAETMHSFYTYLEDNPSTGQREEPKFHEMSHGESFLNLLRTRFDAPGFYLMDEPEAALSFQSCLGLVALLHDLATGGSQVVVATHSPLLASLPGATILQLDDDGLSKVSWDELELVRSWRTFLAEPNLYLRPLLEEGD